MSDETLVATEADGLPGRGGDLGEFLGEDTPRSTGFWGLGLDVEIFKGMGCIDLRLACSIAASSSLRVGSLTGDLG